MKRGLLISLFLLFCLVSQAQKDTASVAVATMPQAYAREVPGNNVSIYPVPVREDNFSIRTDKEFLNIRITNIIGQEVLRLQYNSPQQFTRVFLENPKRGMYLVAIGFSDGSKVVKKIMVEESE